MDILRDKPYIKIWGITHSTKDRYIVLAKGVNPECLKSGYLFQIL